MVENVEKIRVPMSSPEPLFNEAILLSNWSIWLCLFSFSFRFSFDSVVKRGGVKSSVSVVVFFKVVVVVLDELS